MSLPLRVGNASLGAVGMSSLGVVGKARLGMMDIMSPLGPGKLTFPDTVGFTESTAGVLVTNTGTVVVNVNGHWRILQAGVEVSVATEKALVRSSGCSDK
jgi:hypothetical protein